MRCTILVKQIPFWQRRNAAVLVKIGHKSRVFASIRTAHASAGDMERPEPRISRNAETDRHPCMATEHELSAFLEEVERRAFKQALYAVRKEEAALDVVQDAMMKLAASYGDRPAAELPLLFQRILQNTIRDHFRREKVRNLWVSLFSGLRRRNDDDDDPLETYMPEDAPAAGPGADQVEREQVLSMIEAEVKKLPGRQREAFLMRYWQELDIAETAAAMGCSEGSVKTHCSRATHALARALKAKGITL